MVHGNHRRSPSWNKFCVEVLEDALAKYGRPEIFNSDQGSQFSGRAFTGMLIKSEIAISMDGKGAWRDNVFVERLWGSIEYEEVYLRAYEDVPEARPIHRPLPRLLPAAGHIRRLTDALPIRPTSTRCQSAR